QSFTIEKDVALEPGASVKVGGYEFRFDGVQRVEGPNYDGVGGKLAVTRAGAPGAGVKPEKGQYWGEHPATSEASIRMSRGSNILVALGEDLGAGRWSLRIQIRPLVSLIWLAAFIMAVGGAVAASDRRYRAARVAAAAPEAAGSPAG